MRPKKKLLLLIPTLSSGGAERVITTLLKFLDRSLFDLEFAVVDTRDSVYLDDIPSDIRLIDLKATRVRFAIPKIMRLIHRVKPDVVFSTLGHLNLAIAVCRRGFPKGTRLIARETTIVSENLKQVSFPALWRWAYRNIYPQIDAVVCQSFAMRDDLVQNFGMDSNKITVINNPVDVGRIQKMAQTSPPRPSRVTVPADSKSPIRVVAAGRLGFEKGFDLLLRAIALCQDPRFSLTLLGSGPLEQELKSLANELGIAQQIRFQGFERNPYQYFAEADVFVLSSRYEGFPNVVLEALACGTPIISTPALGGVSEILAGLDSCSAIAEEISARAICKALKTFNYDRRPTVNAIDRFLPSKIVPAYERLFMGGAVNPS